MRKSGRYLFLAALACVGSILLWLGAARPGLAHWADLAVAEVQVGESSVQMTLTYPTGLTEFADRDRNGQLSETEVRDHAQALRSFLSSQIQVVDSERRPGILSVEPLASSMPLPPTLRTAPANSHTTLRLNFAWSQPVQGLQMRYGLFLPDVSTASCLATISGAGQLRTFLFTPTRQTLALTPGLSGLAAGEILLAIAGAFVWGALHSMSPGHGKTVVGAYLVGERATPKHAVLLALTTTITHTIGVFGLGLVTLLAAQYVLPEQLYPWLSLASGVMVVCIGIDMLRKRLAAKRHSHAHPPDPAPGHAHHHSHHEHAHGHPHQGHSHSHAVHEAHAPVVSRAVLATPALAQPYVPLLSAEPAPVRVPASATGAIGAEMHPHPHEASPAHRHSHRHPHAHGHPHAHLHDAVHSHDQAHGHAHGHSHLPPGADGEPVTWRSLIALGISGGLVPCPAALVLLLSAIALGKTGVGLLLVLAFSLGLAGVLTGLGLLLVRAKHWFKQVPTPGRFARAFPVLSALGITLLGAGISLKALTQLFP